MSHSRLFSPLDSRYQKYLPERLSEGYFLQSQIDVEKAWLLALVESGRCPTIAKAELDQILEGLNFAEIEAIEERTQHATRALVEAIAERLKKAGRADVAKWVHVGITSFDTVDTAQRSRLKDFIQKDFEPLLQKLKERFKEKALKFQKTPQVGRTHGQWAVPTFFGLSFAEAYHRIDELEVFLSEALQNLRGQASGAIGGYHAPALLSAKPLELEKIFLQKLGLKPHFSSIQTLPPEDIWNLASQVFSLSSVVYKVANDLRHLARSEIAEISEGLRPGQVGSSTMPQKRNPWNLEHVCSLYKLLQSRLSLLMLDQSTEHQRDLCNSASGRFYAEYFAFAYLMFKRLDSVLERLEVHEENMQKHLDSAGSSVLAEAFYILLSMNGVSDAHSKVREAARESEAKNTDLLSILQEQKHLDTSLSLKGLEEKIAQGSQLKFAAIFSKRK